MQRMPSLLKSRHRLLHMWASPEREINPAEVSSDGNWIFSQSRTTSLRRSDLMAIVMGRLMNKDKHHIAHILRKRCIKKNFKEFTIASRTIQHFVTRNSALIELKNYASRWTGRAEKFHLSLVERRVLEI